MSFDISMERYRDALETIDIQSPDFITADSREAVLSGITSVSLPENVTQIGSNEFDYAKDLISIAVNADNPVYCDIDGVLYSKDKTVLIRYPRGRQNSKFVIPEHVTEIGASAFYNCTNLTSIDFPNRLKLIGKSAFAMCSGLTSVSIPDGITNIESQSFSHCKNLINISIPASVTNIEHWAFGGNGRLNISVDANNKNFCDIDGVLFSKDKTKILTYAKGEIQPNYTIPNGVISIARYAFDSCESLTGISIPNSVTDIDNWAFLECENLTRINIPNSVTNIGKGAFNGCKNLTSISVPSSVTSIGDGAFYDCESLANVYYEGSEAEWKRINIEFGNENLINAAITTV